MAEHDPSRTEPATAKRRNEARNKGQVAKSREIGPVVITFGGLLTLTFLSGWMMNGIAAIFRDTLSSVGSVPDSVEAVHTLLGRTSLRCAIILLPVFAATVICAIGSSVAQIGWLWTFEPLMPKFDKLNPIAGMGRLFSLQAFAEMAKSVLKLLIVGWFAWKVIQRELIALPGVVDSRPDEIVVYIATICGEIILKTTVVLGILALVDYAYQRWEYERGMRMTKEEVKEEGRAAEGDPMIKGRIKQLMRERARRLIFKEVPKADVIITNPTHFAIALKYDKSTMHAPTVTAKGSDQMAKRIREIAKEHGIPVVERPPLARALWKECKEGQEVPFEFYKAVAEVLAYVYRLSGRKAAV